jgi:hypothetical protein
MYRLLRTLFIAGLALSVILYFVPFYKPAGDVLKAWLATGGVARRLSSFDLCRLLVHTGHVQWGAFYMALSGIEVALLVLALRRPRRWVFVAGSCEQLYLLISFLLRPASTDLSDPWLTHLLLYVSSVLCLTGFLIRPPVNGDGAAVVARTDYAS